MGAFGYDADSDDDCNGNGSSHMANIPFHALGLRRRGYPLTPGGTTAPPESQDGGDRRGKPDTISQPVDPGGVRGC